VTRCYRCDGTGAVRCKPCAGSGTLVAFVQAVIRRSPSEAVVRTAEDPVGRRARRLWETFGPFAGDQPPAGLPPGVRSMLSAALEEVHKGEVMRELRVGVLRLVSVESEWRGSTRTTFLAGPEPRVIARWAYLASRRLWALLGCGALVAASTALVILRL
jgi:hypothetical protein